ncbi:MAG TPA: malate dehydrogenase [Candidatus Dormibacteraeota bacterium]|nr:malate dehydrogenase [Candidatus Dormibacteraeota bacterium]
MPKISVVGAGNVGASAALYLAEAEMGDVTLIDIVEGVAKGKALDLLEAGPVRGYDTMIEGSGDMKAVAGSDLIIVTAGLPRKPGMSRTDLLKANADIIRGIAQAIKEHAPKAIVITVTNPLDVMTYLLHRITGFPRERVIGMAGVLDSARFRAFLAMEIGASVEDIQAMVLGGHGDTMVPLLRYSTVGGVPIEKFIGKERLAEIVQRTRDGGAEIVKLLQTGSAFYAPAASAVQMAESILRDKKRLLPACAYLNGEYGFRDLYLGVPVILGSRGMEKIVELDLTAEEKAALSKSAEEVKKGIADLELEPAAR